MANQIIPEKIHLNQIHWVVQNTVILEKKLVKNPTYDFKMELLRLGSWCKIIEPIWYRNEMKEIITKMNKKYE